MGVAGVIHAYFPPLRLGFRHAYFPPHPIAVRISYSWRGITGKRGGRGARHTEASSGEPKKEASATREQVYNCEGAAGCSRPKRPLRVHYRLHLQHRLPSRREQVG